MIQYTTNLSSKLRVRCMNTYIITAVFSHKKHHCRIIRLYISTYKLQFGIGLNFDMLHKWQRDKKEHDYGVAKLKD